MFGGLKIIQQELPAPNFKSWELRIYKIEASEVLFLRAVLRENVDYTLCRSWFHSSATFRWENIADWSMNEKFVIWETKLIGDE